MGLGGSYQNGPNRELMRVLFSRNERIITARCLATSRNAFQHGMDPGARRALTLVPKMASELWLTVDHLPSEST